MSSGPWYKRYASDALTGYRSLTLEQRGAYTTILDLLYDAGGPLPSSERWMAGQLDVSPRKWRALRDELVAAGKIIILDDGSITNARFEKETGKRAAISAKRAEAGAKGGAARQTALPLDDQDESSPPENEPSSAEFSSFSTPENELSGKDNSDEPERKPAENSHSGQANASILPPLRARDPDTRYQKLDRRILSNSDSPRTADDVEKPFDLLGWTTRFARAGGVAINPVYPDKLGREVQIVKGWIDDGIDAEATILPTIEVVIAKSTEASFGSLRFYDGAVRKAHALKSAKTAAGRATKPAKPLPAMREADADDDRVRTIREKLKGATNGSYAAWLDPKDCALRVEDDEVLVVTLRTGFHQAHVDGNLLLPLEAAAKAVLGRPLVRTRHL